jgi:hypothetical protein
MEIEDGRRKPGRSPSELRAAGFIPAVLAFYTSNSALIPSTFAYRFRTGST